MKITNATIMFAVNEGGKEKAGVGDVTMPDITYKTEEITGAGLMGSYNSVLAGQLEAMKMTINFRNTTEDFFKLSTPVNHTLDIRDAQQVDDSVLDTTSVSKIKHIVRGKTISASGGSIKPASPHDASLEIAVNYWATYLDGKKIREIDILNHICYIDGTDYFADVREALGE